MKLLHLYFIAYLFTNVCLTASSSSWDECNDNTWQFDANTDTLASFYNEGKQSQEAVMLKKQNEKLINSLLNKHKQIHSILDAQQDEVIAERESLETRILTLIGNINKLQKISTHQSHYDVWKSSNTIIENYRKWLIYDEQSTKQNVNKSQEVINKLQHLQKGIHTTSQSQSSSSNSETNYAPTIEDYTKEKLTKLQCQNNGLQNAALRTPSQINTIFIENKNRATIAKSLLEKKLCEITQQIEKSMKTKGNRESNETHLAIWNETNDIIKSSYTWLKNRETKTSQAVQATDAITALNDYYAAHQNCMSPHSKINDPITDCEPIYSNSSSSSATHKRSVGLEEYSSARKNIKQDKV